MIINKQIEKHHLNLKISNIGQKYLRSNYELSYELLNVK